MIIEEAKEKLLKDGYCTFDLKDFNSTYYNLFEKIKYKTSDDKYLENFIAMKFDYHSQDSNVHSSERYVLKTFEESIIKTEYHRLFPSKTIELASKKLRRLHFFSNTIYSDLWWQY